MKNDVPLGHRVGVERAETISQRIAGGTSHETADSIRAEGPHPMRLFTSPSFEPNLGLGHLAGYVTEFLSVDEGIADGAQESRVSWFLNYAGNASEIRFPSKQADDEACMGNQMAAANGSVHGNVGALKHTRCQVGNREI